MSKHGPLKCGEINAGKVFVSYDSSGWEWWVTEERFEELRLKKNLCTKRCEAKPEAKQRKRQMKNYKYSTDKEYREKIRKQVNAWNNANPKRYLMKLAKGRAKLLGVPFSLSEKDFEIPDFCPVLHIPLRRSRGCGPAPGSPTLDRFRPELGYVKGNVFVISSKANRIKNNANPEELKAVLQWVESVQKPD